MQAMYPEFCVWLEMATLMSVLQATDSCAMRQQPFLAHKSLPSLCDSSCYFFDFNFDRLALPV